MFREDLVEGVDEVLHAVVEGKGIPWPYNLELLRCSEKVVKLYPFLLDLSGPTLMKHRMIAAMAVKYLKKFFGLMVGEGVDWVMDFEAFARANCFI